MLHTISPVVYLLPIVVLSFYYLYRKKKQYRIRQWRKALNIEPHARIFHQLYENTNGFMLSQQARQRHDALDYVYGEIEFVSFLALLSLTKLDENTVFYDLGCGTGKAVLACAMVFPIHKGIGVEILPELYLSACTQAEQLAMVAPYNELTKKIAFILGDFLDIALDEATLIFINATSLFNPTWENLCLRLEHLPHLTTVITTSKSLPSKEFVVETCTPVEMSWGVVQAYIHQRKKQ